jgi:hypothetical protein
MFCPGDTLLLVKQPVAYHFHVRPVFIRDRMDFFFPFYQKLYDAVLDWFLVKTNATKHLLKTKEKIWLSNGFPKFSDKHIDVIKRNVSGYNFFRLNCCHLLNFSCFH